MLSIKQCVTGPMPAFDVNPSWMFLFNSCLQGEGNSSLLTGVFHDVCV